MNEKPAAENLQVIRTLMERSALYRRTLAPIMIFAGVSGTTAAVAGWGFVTVRGFVALWFGVAVITLLGALWLTRRQALKDAEPFWSAPLRRVTQAMLPPLAAGLVIGVCVLVAFAQPSQVDPPTGALEMDGMIWLPATWSMLYGFALHAAGFFTPRGLRWFGWILVFFGLSVFAGMAFTDRADSPAWWSQAMMGCCFGLTHLAYGIYLYLTEKKSPA